jgi:hypothetical protein
MTNKHASKQHGLVGRGRPKSKLRKRVNKAKARLRREERVASKVETTEKAVKPVKVAKKVAKKVVKKEETVETEKKEQKED